MLLGEDLRGRHERRLPAVLDRLQGRERRHQRLAASHVALQQAAHGMRVREVLRDHRLRLALRAGEGERQRFRERVGERVRVGKRGRALRAALPVGDAHRELLREELVELEPLPRRVRAVLERRGIRVGRGTMQREDGIAKRHEAEVVEELRVKRVPQIERVERGVDLVAQELLREPRRGRVHRRERLRQRRALGDDPVTRMHHLVAEESRAHLAEEAQALARRELLHLARIEVHEPHPELALAILELHHERAPAAVLDLRFDDLGLDQHRDARLCVGERRQASLVLVAQRKVQDEVAAAVDAELREPGGRRVGCCGGGQASPGASRRRPRPANRAGGRPRRWPRARDRAP